MRKLSIILSVLIINVSFAQKPAILMNDTIKGKVNKVVVEFYKTEEDRSGNLIAKRDDNDFKHVYYFDDDQNLVKDEYWFDYSKLDPTGKTKPQATITNHDPEPAAPKNDTIFTHTDTTSTFIIKKPSGEKEFLHIKEGNPKFMLRIFENKDAKMTGKLLYKYESSGRLLSKTIYYTTDFEKVLSIDDYNEQGNIRLSNTFNENGSPAFATAYSYKYDSRGNYVVRQEQKWNESEKKFITIAERRVTYYYSKK